MKKELQICYFAIVTIFVGVTESRAANIIGLVDTDANTITFSGSANFVTSTGTMAAWGVEFYVLPRFIGMIDPVVGLDHGLTASFSLDSDKVLLSSVRDYWATDGRPSGLSNINVTGIYLVSPVVATSVNLIGNPNVPYDYSTQFADAIADFETAIALSDVVLSQLSPDFPDKIILTTNRPDSVPDGGTTVAFFAMTVVGFTCLRRKLSS